MQKLCATLFLLCSGVLAFAQPLAEKPNVTIQAAHGVSYNEETGIASATNGVVIKYGEATLTARDATLNERIGEIEAVGNVQVINQGEIWVGESLRYNYLTRKVVAENFRAGQGMFFTSSQALVGDGAAGIYAGANSILTADDYANPTFRIEAKSLVIVPGQYVEAEQATVYAGKVPVFYLPHYHRSLTDEGNRWEVLPGYRSAFGPFVFGSYRWFRSESLDGRMIADAMQKRGLGLGPEFDWRLKEWGDGTLKTYYVHDLDPGEDANLQPIDADRYRVHLVHTVTPETNLTIKVVARYQSDPLVIHDFFEGEYKKNIQPSTFLEADQLWSNYGLDVLVQPRINDFFETVERLPDIKLTGLRQQIGTTPLYYESDSSFGYYHRQFPSGSTNESFSALRADTYHQLVLPQTFFNWLNVIPRVGGRFTHYGQAEGSGATTTEQDRGVFNTGAEFTFKASQTWPGIQSGFWQVDGLRHIIEPSFNYAYVPNPTVSPGLLPQFDYEVPTTRLLPIEFPDYNSIDSIDSQNVLRLGLRNKFQTKRKGIVDNLVHWNLYTDWRLTRHSGQNTFSDLYSDVDVKPWTWLTLSSGTRFDFDHRDLNEAINYVTIEPNNTWSLGLGHRYLRPDLSLGTNSGDNLILGTIYYRVNENWGLRMNQQYQARDGTLQEQSYALYRDFRSWTGALNFRVRENQGGPTDYTVAITFSLKAFPRFSPESERVHPSRLLGY